MKEELQNLTNKAIEEEKSRIYALIEKIIYNSKREAKKVAKKGNSRLVVNINRKIPYKFVDSLKNRAKELSEELRDDKSNRPHDGRHELPSIGGNRFDPTGKITVVARFFHQRNRDAPRRGDIGRGASRNHAEQSAGHDGGLGGSSPQVAHSGKRQIDEERARAGYYHQPAKYYKNTHYNNCDARGRAIDTGCVEIVCGNDIFQS